MSLRGLLREVLKYPQIVSRAHYMSHFANAEACLHEIGEQEFDWIAGEGGAIIAVFVTVVIIKPVGGSCEP
jgi:hypothetical protein